MSSPRALPLALLLPLSLSLLLPTTAHADEPIPTLTVRFEHGRRHYVFSGQRIHGEVQGPYRFDLGTRHAPTHCLVDPQRSFVDRVVSVVRHTPF